MTKSTTNNPTKINNGQKEFRTIAISIVKIIMYVLKKYIFGMFTFLEQFSICFEHQLIFRQ